MSAFVVDSFASKFLFAFLMFSRHVFVSRDVLVPFHMRVDASVVDTSTCASPDKASESKRPRVSPVATTSESTKEAEHMSDSAPLNANQDHQQEGNSDRSAVDTSKDQVPRNDDDCCSIKHGVLDEEKKSIVFQRYCHVYEQGELKELALSLNSRHATNQDQNQSHDWVAVIDEFYDTGNWCIVLQKTRECPACYC